MRDKGGEGAIDTDDEDECANTRIQKDTKQTSIINSCEKEKKDI